MTRKAAKAEDARIEHPAWCADHSVSEHPEDDYHWRQIAGCIPGRNIQDEETRYGQIGVLQHEEWNEPRVCMDEVPHTMTPLQAISFAYRLVEAATLAGHPGANLNRALRGSWREDGSYGSGNGWFIFRAELIEGMTPEQCEHMYGFADGYGAGLQAMWDVLRPRAGVPTIVQDS